jgi:hypothetical protein
MDPQKVPDAPRRDIAYAGASLISRYGKRRELEDMMTAIDRVIDRAPDLASRIVELSCDSKACAYYTVACVNSEPPPYEVPPDQLQAIGRALDQAFRAVGGHNGITVISGAARIDVGAWWRGDSL